MRLFAIFRKTRILLFIHFCLKNVYPTEKLDLFRKFLQYIKVVNKMSQHQQPESQALEDDEPDDWCVKFE